MGSFSDKSGIFSGLKTKESQGQGDLFFQILDHFPDMIQSVDEDGKIVYANIKATELLGYSNQELIGKSVFEIYAPHLRDLVKSGLKDLKSKGVKAVKSQVATKKGEIVDVEIRSLSLYDEEGSFVKTFSVIRDIRELNYLRAQLIQSSKLASIGEFASGIVHDIKNPLIIIDSYAQMIEKDFENPGKIKKAGEKIKAAGERIKKLCDHMRIFVRGGVEESVAVDLSKILDNSLLMLETAIKKSSASFESKLAGKNLVIECRQNQIEQVLMNLIGNACDAVADAPIREILVDGEDLGDSIVLHIEDSGPGISKENIAKIFDAFFTTKPAGKGTGLGLSITNGIIREHGGSIDVTESKFGGAAFLVKLPKKMSANQS